MEEEDSSIKKVVEKGTPVFSFSGPGCGVLRKQIFPANDGDNNLSSNSDRPRTRGKRTTVLTEDEVCCFLN